MANGTQRTPSRCAAIPRPRRAPEQQHAAAAGDTSTPAIHAEITHPDPKEDAATPPPKKVKTRTDIAIEEAAARLAANAPPLSPEQRRRIAELFSTVVNTSHRPTR